VGDPRRLLDARIAALRHWRAAHIVVKDHDFVGAEKVGQEVFDLGIIHPAHFFNIVEIDHLGVVSGELKALIVQRELVGNGTTVVDRYRLLARLARPARYARWGLTHVGDGLLSGID
jgi:hypothetical protein